MNIELHIDRLVLDGFPLTAAQGAAVRAAVEAELSRILNERGLTGLASTQISSALGSTITASTAATPFGQAIAHAAYAGLQGLSGPAAEFNRAPVPKL